MQKSRSRRLWYISVMDYIEYKLAAAIVLVIACFFVNLIYSAITGKTLGQAQTDTKAAQRQD